jgi:hypothetical protein
LIKNIFTLSYYQQNYRTKLPQNYHTTIKLHKTAQNYKLSTQLSHNYHHTIESAELSTFVDKEYLSHTQKKNKYKNHTTISLRKLALKTITKLSSTTHKITMHIKQIHSLCTNSFYEQIHFLHKFIHSFSPTNLFIHSVPTISLCTHKFPCIYSAFTNSLFHSLSFPLLA